MVYEWVLLLTKPNDLFSKIAGHRAKFYVSSTFYSCCYMSENISLQQSPFIQDVIGIE